MRVKWSSWSDSDGGVNHDDDDSDGINLQWLWCLWWLDSYIDDGHESALIKKVKIIYVTWLRTSYYFFYS